MAKKEFDQRLLVEGQDDQHVVWALCEKFKLQQNFDVVASVGIDKIFAEIPVRTKESSIRTLGVVIDADQNLEKRWQQVVSSFANADITLDSLPETGYIGQFEDIRIGVWIMPNNKLSGMLEDFAAFLIPSGDLMVPYADEVLQKIEGDKSNKYSLIHRSKAKIHTWLAWQVDPGTPMGYAITKRYLSVEEPTCKVFVDWLRELYGA